MRIGHGYDVHRLTEGRRLILGGVEVPYEKGLLGHSDADVLTHAVMDALLGAAALGQITVQKAFAVHGICAEQLHLTLVQQLGNGIGHPIILPVIKTAAAGGQCQHRHTGMAVHLKLHLTAQNRAPLFVICLLYTSDAADD